MDIGKVSAYDKPRISKESIKLPAYFGNLLNLDIGYGYNARINDINMDFLLLIELVDIN